jgi:hypothetical protein
LSYGGNYGKQDGSVAKKTTEYLFGKPDDSEFLDTKTRIKGREFFNAIFYYRLLGQEFKCEAAQRIANTLERMAISDDGLGRLEAVETLRQQLPREEVVLKGIAESMVKKGKE